MGLIMLSIYALISQIMLVNLLIAMMNDSFSKVKENSGKVCLLLREECFLPFYLGVEVFSVFIFWGIQTYEYFSASSEFAVVANIVSLAVFTKSNGFFLTILLGFIPCTNGLPRKEKKKHAKIQKLEGRRRRQREIREYLRKICVSLEKIFWRKLS